MPKKCWVKFGTFFAGSFAVAPKGFSKSVFQSAWVVPMVSCYCYRDSTWHAITDWVDPSHFALHFRWLHIHNAGVTLQLQWRQDSSCHRSAELSRHVTTNNKRSPTLAYFSRVTRHIQSASPRSLSISSSETTGDGNGVTLPSRLTSA